MRPRGVASEQHQSKRLAQSPLLRLGGRWRRNSPSQSLSWVMRRNRGSSAGPKIERNTRQRWCAPSRAAWITSCPICRSSDCANVTGDRFVAAARAFPEGGQSLEAQLSPRLPRMSSMIRPASRGATTRASISESGWGSCGNGGTSLPQYRQTMASSFIAQHRRGSTRLSHPSRPPSTLPPPAAERHSVQRRFLAPVSCRGRW